MNRQEILEGLKEILLMIKPTLDLETVSDETQLFSELGLDSLTIMLLALSMEKKYGFKFENTLKFNTIGEVIDYIIQQKS